MTTKQLLYIRYEHKRKKRNGQPDRMLAMHLQLMIDCCGIHSPNTQPTEPVKEFNADEIVKRMMYNSKVSHRKKASTIIKQAKASYRFAKSPVIRMQREHNRLVTLQDLYIRDAINK